MITFTIRPSRNNRFRENLGFALVGCVVFGVIGSLFVDLSRDQMDMIRLMGSVIALIFFHSWLGFGNRLGNGATP